MSEEKNIPNCIADRRLGKFRLTRQLLESLTDQQLEQMFRPFVVSRAEYYWPGDTVEYSAFSPLFPRVPEGSDGDHYTLVLYDDGQIDVKAG